MRIVSEDFRSLFKKWIWKKWRFKVSKALGLIIGKRRDTLKLGWIDFLGWHNGY